MSGGDVLAYDVGLTVSVTAVLEKAEVVQEERSGNHLFVVISSDRGLCGSIHSNLARTIRPIMADRSTSANTYFVCVGDKVATPTLFLIMPPYPLSYPDSHNSATKLQQKSVPVVQ